MKAYFQLSLKMLARAIRKSGLHPLIGVALLVFLFIFGSLVLFDQTEFAGFVIAFLAIQLLLRLSFMPRIEFLNLQFGSRTRMIRLLENTFVSFPFVLVLLANAEWLAGSIVGGAVILSSFLTIRRSRSRSMPTPFSRNLFEFSQGFRRTWLAFPLAIALLVIGIQVNNPNLALSSVVLVFLVSASFYTNPEPAYFPWSEDKTPQQFLWKKIGQAVYNVSLLSLPLLIVVVIKFPFHLLISAIIFGLGLLLLILMVLAKYTAYPDPIGVPQAIILSVCFYLPPLALLALPYFYSRAKTSLSTLLYDPAALYL